MQILSAEKFKTQENGWKIHYQQHKVSCEFFSVVLDNVVRIRDKMQVVYKEMACDRARSNMEKWDLIDRIQFKYMKNCPMFMQSNDLVCSDWTLDVVFTVRDGMSVVWCVCCEKRSGKTHVNLKIIPINLNLTRRGSYKGHNNNTYQNNEPKISS